jgi:hypothetical protein
MTRFWLGRASSSQSIQLRPPRLFETPEAEVLWLIFDPVEIAFYASLGFGVATILAATWVLLRGR